MSKIIYAVLTAFAIELSLFLFAGSTSGTSGLFGLLMDPSGIATDSLYLLVVVALGAIGASTIIIGTFYNINIYGVYASIGLVILSFIFSIAHLWVFLNGELTSVFQMSNSSVIATMICAPLLIAYIFIIAGYVRDNN